MANTRGVSGVVLRSCYREPVSESIHLFRVDRKHAKAILDEGFNESTPSDFNGDSHLDWLAVRSLLKSFHQGKQPLATVGDVVLLDRSSLAIEQYNAVSLRSTINSNKITEALIQNSLLCFVRDALVIPVPALIGPADGATPHWTFLHHGSTVKAQVPPNGDWFHCVAEALLTASYVKTELLDGAASFKSVQVLRAMKTD